MGRTIVTIKVILVDDHPVVLEGLKAALESHGLEVVGAFQTASEAADAIATIACDAVMIDVRLPDESGLELVARLSGKPDHPAFVVVSQSDSPRYAEAAFDAGAVGFMSKTTSTGDLVEAIRRAARGELVFSATLLPGRRRPISTLRSSDWRVVERVIAGRGNDEIAGDLEMSTKSVERSLTRLFAASGTTNRTELAVKAEREGWLDPPDATSR